MIPIWFGLQSSCAIDRNYSPNVIDPDPTKAAAQGKSEADTAAQKASSLGLGNTIIYKDIENYDTTNVQCSSSVIANVSGWVAELHSLGYSSGAGVYANPAPAAQDISKASPLPDEIWVTHFDSKATIWNLGTTATPFGDGLWPTNQRSHQYLNYATAGTGETYGTFPSSAPFVSIGTSTMLRWLARTEPKPIPIGT